MAQKNSLILSVTVLYISGALASVEDLTHSIDQSLVRQDYRIIVRAGRGGMAPGIADEQQAEARARCGVRYLEGFGDVIAVGKEGEFEQLQRYATDYNRRMIEHCMAPKPSQ